MISTEFLSTLPTNDRSKLRTISKYYNDVLHVLSVRSQTQVLPDQIHQLFNKVIFPMEEVLFFVVPGAGGDDDFAVLGMDSLQEEELEIIISGELEKEVKVTRVGIDKDGFRIVKG